MSLKYNSMLAALLVLTVLTAQAGDIRVFGDRTISEEETITGDVVAVTGDLMVKGKVTGSVIAYVGDITLASSAVVEGSVVAKRGRVYRQKGARISGEIVEGCPIWRTTHGPATWASASATNPAPSGCRSPSEPTLPRTLTSGCSASSGPSDTDDTSKHSIGG